MAIEHNVITDPEIHEPKGVAAAEAGDTYIADGAGSGDWTTRMGWWNYNDLTTASAAIPLTLAATDYDMTNDGAGAQTITTYALPGATAIWDVATDRFDFTDLDIGDTVEIRVDLIFTTTTVNTAYTVDLEAGIGGSNYTIPIIEAADKKTAGTYGAVCWMGMYIGDANTRDNPARIIASADKTGVTVKVNGWYIRVIKRGM